MAALPSPYSQMPAFASPQMPDAQQPPPMTMPSPEQIDALVNMGLIDEQLAENLKQRQGLEAAQNMEGPQGRSVGGSYQAASPLEHLGSLAGKASAMYREHKLAGEAEQLRGKSRAGRKTAYDLYLSSLQQGQTPPMIF